MMRNPITKMGVVVYSFLSVLSAHADSSAVAYAKTITERLGHESFNDLQSGTSKVETIQGTFPISLFFAGRWSFTITPETGAFMIDDSSFTDRAKFLDKRPTGYSEEELLKRVEEMFSRLRWRRDID